MNTICRKCGLSQADGATFGMRGGQLSQVCKSCTNAASRASKAKTRGATPRRVQPTPVVAVSVTKATTSAATDYVPPRDLVATWAAVQMIAKDGALAPNLLFTGPSGCGKTEAARYLARMANLPIVKVDAASMTDPEAWFGTREVVVKDGAPMTVYQESDFARGLQMPCLMLIDEINRVSDAVRQILNPLFDDSREVMNPLTGLPLKRHPLCFVVMTGNVGLAFTGTYAVDPSLLTRALTVNFDYLGDGPETQLAVSRTGCRLEDAALFIRFATETRDRAKNDPDWMPISTREVLAACSLVAHGLDVTTAARVAIINGTSGEGGADSTRASLEMIWTGIRPRD